MAKKKEAFTIFNDKQAPTKELLDVILDKGLTNRFDTLDDYLEKNNFTYDEKSLQKLIKLTDHKIQSQLHYYSHLMYYYMERSGDWGESGEQQVKIAFCRHILKIPPKQNLSQADALRFMTKMDDTLETLDIKQMSAETAKTQLKHYMFNLFGKSFEAFRAPQLNKIMRFIGSKRFLHGGQYGADLEFILCEGKKITKRGYDIIYAQKEIVRTPNNVMCMAAIIGHQTIYLRIEALKTIFSQKWTQIFDYGAHERHQISDDPFWDIAEGIKEKVLALYNVNTKAELEGIEKQFLNDMAETILYHELGHGIIQHDLLPSELGAIGEATKLYGENIFTAFLEFLADFAPSHEGILGPIHNMIAISKKDLNRATRMYYMYLSDVWFYNTADTYMFSYSDLMCLILIPYIQEDGCIQFDKMEQDLQFSKDRDPSQPTSLFESIFDLYCTNAEEIKRLTEVAQFTVVGQTVNYKQVKDILVAEFVKNDGYVHEDRYEFLVPFWTNMIGYIQQFSDSKAQMADFIQHQEKKLINKVFLLSAGRTKAESYQFDYRTYISETMMSVGICTSIKLNKAP